MPTPRQLVLPAAAGGCLALAALAALAATGAVPASDAVVLGVVLLLLGAQALVLLTVRRADGKAMRVDARTKRCEAELARLSAATERLDARLDEIAGLLAERRHRHDEDLREILASLGEDRLHAMSLRQEVARLADLLPRPDGAAPEPARRRAAAESGT
ncbi:hypothetical protein [Planomonospora alba]